MKKNYSLLFILITLLIVCTNSEKEVLVSYSNPEIDYWGRIDSSQIKRTDLYWAGSSIKINFEGESIYAALKNDSGNNYHNIILDNDSVRVFRPDSIQKYYELASNLSKGKHSIEIFKRTNSGKTSFYGFKIKNHAKLLEKSAPKKRSIEFYGNSITAGYAIEDTSGKDNPSGTNTNNYKTYAALTARHFNANYRAISQGGIGVTISWFPLIMPEMYDRLIPDEPTPKWDFSLYQPDIVVINLFQNDSWLVNLPERKEFKTNFGDKAPSDEYLINAYQNFVSSLRKQYPKAKIICTLGSMDGSKKGSKWMDYIQSAVTNLNDKNVFTYFMPYKETPGHPSVQENEVMANGLIQFIDKNIKW